ncbi:hypothetical protein HBA54_00025 [Pelagibius litoralis]|uniref:Sel1 repeat family protein n=1 Tax=Pelagibius litoralis TaxID=374515 RepID=A0A967C9K2_9PROT|nr:hypothetical protein [Pelagibius litoralis]NIA66973.1 hypothetical protein [Pelagibius litoralis]
MRARFVGVLLATMLSLLALPVSSQAAESENDEAKAQIKAAYIAMVRKDLESALKTLEPLVEDRNGEALYLKAYIHERNLEYDIKHVYTWYEEAARYGSPLAMYKTAYQFSILGLHDHGYLWALKAAKLGMSNGLVLVSQYYCTPVGVVPQDALIADAWRIIALDGFKFDDPVWQKGACGPKDPDDFRRGQLAAQVDILKRQFNLPPLKDHYAEWKQWKAEALADTSVQEPE